ncbi:MAG: hypothetical protein Q8S84_04335 [bacterium]|nr:hypothetical protein [bacterium]
MCNHSISGCTDKTIKSVVFSSGQNLSSIIFRFAFFAAFLLHITASHIFRFEICVVVDCSFTSFTSFHNLAIHSF